MTDLCILLVGTDNEQISTIPDHIQAKKIGTFETLGTMFSLGWGVRFTVYST
jgi:hypothetical protein